MPKTLLLRAHHLEGVRQVHQTPRSNFANLSLIADYTPEFLGQTHDLVRQVFQNPDQMFLIVADEPDLICQLCIDMQGNPSCSFAKKLVGQPVKRYVSAAFGTPKKSDREITEQYNFQINLKYSANQIKQKMNF